MDTSLHFLGLSATTTKSVKSTKSYHTETYDDGSSYEGEMLGPLRHGKGKLAFADGTYYDGEWNQGKMAGYGILYYYNGFIAYEGEWSNNRFEGKGAMYNEHQSEKKTQLSQIIEDKTWTRYEGDFSHDRWHGTGKLFFSNGDEFYGDFKNDIIHGRGTYSKHTGEVISGEWRNNRMISQYF